jgi:hypothetical protein
VHSFELADGEAADLEQIAAADGSSSEVVRPTCDGERITAAGTADALERAEDAWLAEVAAESLAEEGESIPLEQVKAELGL